MAAKTRAPTAPALMGDWQRRVVLVLLLAGVALAAVGALVPPRGGLYWLAVIVAPLLGGGLGLVLAGGPGRALEARLMASDAPKEAPRPPTPAALPPPLRAALQTAILPVLLAELAGAAARMAPRERAAALALVEAGATAPEGEARQALARDLPGLIAALAAGGATAAGAAEDLARRLALPGGAR
ncbi:hypothetical protein [Neoroseomonas oryzicola]|uniref:Uncharacterized protein n=1 Tax=Neoroseomonas oryzicola TaxID=535904 RepID=A0A9X9WN67_9PROT|nr:hypothetical protein [Neoroseomonas oryzicola]MBR0661777.1 hypothetical protein [Neoroseomonas oryzicola]NKE17951.1 hypothetical protein [Neoroseomonas oryzicola]